MILLDTNVLSETIRPEPSGTVMRWLSSLDPFAVYTTAVSVAEIFYGIAILPSGQRRHRLAVAVEEMFADQFDGKILPFDDDAARWYAGIVAERRAAGRPISQFDAMIAAIARAHRGILATRNVADFESCGIRIIDPWAL